eukprot:m.33856 g.33856  ORF g.33856 m.33856 type:complete len:99 (+) comp31922_c0_seq3:595-891(+)
MLQLESALTQGKFIAIDYDGKLVPPGGISGASDERTYFSWEYVEPISDAPMSSAVFKSKRHKLQILPDVKVVFALHPNSAKGNRVCTVVCLIQLSIFC